MGISNRYDFVLLFDVKDGNPNGDPDAGNLPRLDAETGRGLVTDVSLKRKVRNFVAIKHDYARPFDIYVKERAVLGRSHVQAFKELNIALGEDLTVAIPSDLVDQFDELTLPEGLEVTTEEEGSAALVVSGVLDKKEAQEWIKENDLSKPVKTFLSKTLKEAKSRKPTREETDQGRAKMCETFFDIRTFGAVLSLKSAPNCGQVRGPVQLTFARSIDPIVAAEHSITRMAVATEAEAEKQQGDNRTMGRKFTVPYGLYMAHGFVSSFLTKQTKFSDADLNLLWEALSNMFEHDRSAARGEMATRGLYIFKHDSELGNAPAHKLFDLIEVKGSNGNSGPPRSFSDYTVTSPTEGPIEGFQGVTLIKKVG
ncbi:MAG: type I-C CRISPR-associated protein Cas7/Csd2 [Nitrospirales bacterium]